MGKKGVNKKYFDLKSLVLSDHRNTSDKVILETAAMLIDNSTGTLPWLNPVRTGVVRRQLCAVSDVKRSLAPRKS